jgi:DeoR/GlpR family transcriptional regulator of sugar metabolism
VKLAFVEAADETVLLVDSTKLGQRALARALDWDRISTMVTELDPGDERLDPYRDLAVLL